jgi:hypothetical protein
MERGTQKHVVSKPSNFCGPRVERVDTRIETRDDDEADVASVIARPGVDERLQSESLRPFVSHDVRANATVLPSRLRPRTHGVLFDDVLLIAAVASQRFFRERIV